MFLEQDRAKGNQIVGPMSLDQDPFRWVFLSDVCKHCEDAGCLEACPTGSIVRTEVGSVLVQNDICNGCGYCRILSFGVINRRPQPLPDAGGAFKCTFCSDRQKTDLFRPVPKFVRPNRLCSVDSMIYARASGASAAFATKLVTMTHNFTIPRETSVRGIHAFFLILGEPEAYGLPPKPQVPTIYLKSAWTSAFATAIASVIATLLAFAFLS